MPFQTPTGRNTLGFTFSASITTPEGNFICTGSQTPVLQTEFNPEDNVSQ